MLHWLSGPKQHEDTHDMASTEILEGPETPAPLFAVRAFKHAIFGTPGTVPPKSPRRRSQPDQPRPTQAQLLRPGIPRPKSSSDAPGLRRELTPPDVDLPLSPTKGILMTPGTIAARRKTVSFGEHIEEHDHRRLQKPYPSHDRSGEAESPFEGVRDTSKAKSKLVLAFEDAREDKPRRRTKIGAAPTANELESPPRNRRDGEQGTTADVNKEYEIYREMTTRELKRLKAKNKAAKSYAKAKDEQCEELTSQLTQERQKVDMLQKRALDMEKLIQDLQAQLRASHDLHNAQPAEAPLEPAAAIPHPVDEYHDTTFRNRISREEPSRHRRGISDLLQKRDQRDTTISSAAPRAADTAREPRAELHRKSRRRPHSSELRTSDAELALMSAIDPPPRSTTTNDASAARQVTSGTDATPLQSLNPNTVSRNVRSMSPRDELQKHSTRQRESPPTSTPHTSNITFDSTPGYTPNEPDHIPNFNQSTLLADTSSFPSTLPANTTSIPPPPPPPHHDRVPQVKPSTAWSALNTSSISLAGKSNPFTIPSALSESTATTSKKMLASKAGEEVGEDRLAAARARIAARGRVVS